ncbi:hypothetical protein TSUD_166140 [Trifolium subterraneum]|uniref:PHD-type domain-containing protein n=1 Tax=Trifolium subterraneum TaxID=3900 RepID=A0A2Z6NP05_TRISU|nr:hypothetical protein TSUD_166140 [Trifolium subterraneum]
MCEQCGFGDQPKELMLCDKCDNGFHMKCVRPIVHNNWSHTFHVKSIVTFIAQQQLLWLLVGPTLLTMMLTSTTTHLALAIISVIDMYFVSCNDFFRWCSMVDEVDNLWS